MSFKLPKLVIICLLSYPLLINGIYVCLTVSQARGEACGWLRHSLPYGLLGGLPVAASNDVQGSASPLPCVLLYFFHPGLSTE